jgi:hypothetical protein
MWVTYLPERQWEEISKILKKFKHEVKIKRYSYALLIFQLIKIYVFTCSLLDLQRLLFISISLKHQNTYSEYIPNLSPDHIRILSKSLAVVVLTTLFLCILVSFRFCLTQTKCLNQTKVTLGVAFVNSRLAYRRNLSSGKYFPGQ